MREYAGVKRLLGVQDGAIVAGMTQDCDPIAEHAKALHNIGAGKGKDMWLAADVPLVFVEKYLADNGVTWREFCSDKAHKRRLINDPALAHFRVVKGR